MQTRRIRSFESPLRILVRLVLVATISALSAPAQAVPSFSRQTGASCSQCHTAFPELTAFGRSFKARGYTVDTTTAITDKEGDRTSLDMPGLTPLSLMLEASLTRTNKGQVLDSARPAARNNDVLVPQQLSLFYAGKLAPHLGGFIQLTFDGNSGSFGIDNIDLRYANEVSLFDKELVFGVLLNNNPTVSDLWNSTPAWGVPYASSSVAPTPAAAPLIAGGLAGSVAGLGLYALWNNFLYLEAAAFHSAPVGVARPLEAETGATNIVDGAAPYWRAALAKNFGHQSIMVGTFGLLAFVLPGGTIPFGSAQNRYVDAAVDAQYQYLGESNIITAVASYIHESQQLDASAGAGEAAHVNNTLNATTVSAAYLWKGWVGGRLSFVDIAGSSDTGLYAPALTTGSANGSPNSYSLSAEVNLLPWLNSQFLLRYTANFKFNGADSNYDGSGRAASANNALYALAWLAF